MLKQRVVATSVSLLSVLLIASVARAEAMRQEGLEAMVKLLQADAEAWVKEEPLADETEKKLKAVAYDKESLPALKAVMSKLPASQIDGMYVTSKLLEPLLRAKTEIVREAIPFVKQTQARTAKYKKVRQYSNNALRGFQIPEFRKGMSDQALMRQMAMVQQRRETKRLEELTVLQNNRLVWEIEKLLHQLLALADEREHDELLAGKLISCEEHEDWFFAEVADIVLGRVAKMNEERAKFFYDKLHDPANKLRYVIKNYVDRGKLIIRLDANSDFLMQTRHLTGRKLLILLNALAKPAKMPAVKVPSAAEVYEHESKLKKEKRGK